MWDEREVLDAVQLSSIARAFNSHQFSHTHLYILARARAHTHTHRHTYYENENLISVGDSARRALSEYKITYRNIQDVC
jgi:hypothetical protein